MSLTRDQIAAAIQLLGVRAGDLMIVHSSYKSLGGVEGGPQAVAEALVDAISPGGSVFVPTFNYGNDPYDPDSAPSYDGIITEFLRKLPGAIRSLHPTHAIAGCGPDAADVLRDHDKVHAFGVGSPCWRLWERNAWVLLIGVNHNTNSVAHVAEEALKVPYVDRRRTARIVTREGICETIVRRPGCSDAWDAALDPALRAANVVTDGRIGPARVMLMRAQSVVQVTADLLRDNPKALLCDKNDCDACNTARRMLRQQGT